MIKPSSNWMGWLDELSTITLISFSIIFSVLLMIKYIKQKKRKYLILIGFGLLPLLTLPWTEIRFKPLTPVQQKNYEETMKNLEEQYHEKDNK